VWVWAVVVGLVLGWETPEVEVVRTAREELVLARDGERVVLRKKIGIDRANEDAVIRTDA